MSKIEALLQVPKNFKPQSWALFFSGRGSNVESILKLCHSLESAYPVLVCNKKTAPGVQKALDLGQASHFFLPPYDYKVLTKLLRQKAVEKIFLLGYMKVVPKEFAEDWAGSIFNLHPSLLPKYPGLDSLKKAYLEKDDLGYSIHHVTEDLDQGPIVRQQIVFKAGSYETLSFEEVAEVFHKEENKAVCQFFLDQAQGKQLDGK